PTLGTLRPLDPPLQRADPGDGLGLDGRARPRPPTRRRAAADHLRPCRLVGALHDPEGRRRAQGLGDARPRGGAGPYGALAWHRGRGPACRRPRGRRGRNLMQAFAELLDALSFQPARDAKLRLIEHYLQHTPDPDRGWALAALTGGLSFASAKPALLRSFGEDKIGAELFHWSYDYVGDLAETLALVWETKPDAGPPPSLGEVVETLQRATKMQTPAILKRWLDALDATGRW